MKYLIVDLNIELNGHKFGFVDQLIQWLNENGFDKDEYVFFTNLDNKSFSKRLKPNIHLHYFESEANKQLSPIKKYQSQWEEINNFAIETSCDKVVLMDFDIYQAELGKYKRLPYNVSGIWFRPFLRQKNLETSTSAKLKFVLNQVKKKNLFGWAMRNKSIDPVFILNDNYTVNELNKNHSNRLAYLPDPVFDHQCTETIDIYEKYDISKDKTTFLIFGCIDDRKNVINSLEALSLLPKKQQEKSCLLIVGKITENYRAQLTDKLIEIENSRLFEFRINDEFVSDCEMDDLFAQCDVVLRMNINFFASSGIIGMSAKYNKPSIVSNYGIVADITESYSLGKLVDPLAIEEITEAMKYFVDHKDKPIDSKGEKYYKEHNRDAYARTLLGF